MHYCVAKCLFLTVALKTFEDETYFFIYLTPTPAVMDSSSPAARFLAFIHLRSSFHHPFSLFLKPFLSVMLNKGSLEVLMFTGSHSPRRVVRRPDQGLLNDGREHSLRVERLPGRLCACLLFISNKVLQGLQTPGRGFCPSQVFCCSGGRGGQEGDHAAQRPAREPAPSFPRGYSCGSGADLQQSQCALPGLHMEPDDQHHVRTGNSISIHSSGYNEGSL